MNRHSDKHEVKKISVSEMKPNMVLARDVVNINGLVLMAKGTMLNNINYSTLLNSAVGYIYVTVSSIDESAERFTPTDANAATLEEQRVPVAERPEFIAFARTYEIKREEAKRCIFEISNGGTVDLGDMYRITDDIMAKLRCKSDIFSFMGFIKETDEHTFNHSVNVSLLCNLYGRWIGLDLDDLVNLTTAGLLHDVGKTKIPDEILNKKGPLTNEEFDHMKKHTVLGYRILQNQDIPENIKLAALMHHEKIDGSGYPMGAKDAQIGQIAKIVAICDIYDAMTADRVYRKRLCPFEVIKMFETNVYGQLDTKYLLIFLQNIAYTYIGSWVKLSNGMEAEVVFINGRDLSRPLVRTVDDDFIDLTTIKNISIDSLV